MRVTAVYPRCYVEHSLIKRMIDDVCDEGGDGWGWIMTSDPDHWAAALYNELLNIGWEKERIQYEKRPEGIYITIDQEGWTFSKTICHQPEFYDAIYKIE